MFWTGLMAALAAVVLLKLGTLSVEAQVTSQALTLLFFAALSRGALTAWQRLTRRT